MKNPVKLSIFAIVLVSGMLAALVPWALHANKPAPLDAPQPDIAATQEVGQRPDCPWASISGVSLPCLGGNTDTAPAAPTLVNVWAWWCGPCKDELPVLAEFAAKHPEWEVVGVHADANAAAGAHLLDELNLKLPSYQDSTGTFAQQLGLPAVVPITLVLSPDGTVKATHTRTFASVAELEQALQ